MEGKITLLDATGAEIGETYTRRARQLVKQQRAIWANDTHTAVQFMADTDEEWDTIASPAPPAPTSEPTSTLYALAEQRIHARRLIVWHTVLVFPVLMFIILMGDLARTSGGYMFAAFICGVWLTVYASHVRNYVKTHGILRSKSWKQRHKFRIEAEVEHLRRMGF